jgi:hypothetical protein
MCLSTVAKKPELGIAVMAPKTCSEAISAHSLGHGKSPCFLQVSFLWLVGPDYQQLILPCADGAKNMVCAF